MPLPSNIPLPIPTSHLSPIRLCLVPECLLPCALCLEHAHPRCLPTGQHERPTDWLGSSVGKYLGTSTLVGVSHLSFATPASQSMILPLTKQQTWAEQSRKAQRQSRAEPHLIALGLARSEVEISLSCFFGVQCPPDPGACRAGSAVGSAKTLRYRWTAETERIEARRPPPWSPRLQSSCPVVFPRFQTPGLSTLGRVTVAFLSLPGVSGGYHHTAVLCAAANIQNIDAPMRRPPELTRLHRVLGIRLLVERIACRLGLPIDSVDRQE